MRQFISFTIGSEEYGIDIMAIREIKGWTAVTPLPDTPPHIRGVIDLRGAIVPILDLRTRFGGPPTVATPRHVVIVIAVAGAMAGLLVDAVADILATDDAAIQPVPEMDHQHSHGFLSGLITVDGRMVALLDLDQVFDAHHLAKAAAA